MDLLAIVVIILLLLSLWEWITDHLVIIIGVAVFIAACYFLGVFHTIVIVAILAALIVLIRYVNTIIKKNNEKELEKYLPKHCSQLGQMTDEKWKKELPQYANRSYETSFEFITRNFAERMERTYYVDSKDFSWIDPYVKYLKKNVMASVYELDKLPATTMRTTHCSASGKLIYDALSNLQKYKRINHKPVLEKIQLDPDAVRNLLPNHKGDIPEYYLFSFKLSDAFLSMQNISSDNFESEEISLDDLENMV